MTPAEHKTRHELLDEALNELFADYLRHHAGVRRGTVHIDHLKRWSAEQRKDPTEGHQETAHAFAVCGHCGESITEGEPHVCAGAWPEDGSPYMGSVTGFKR